MDQKGMELKVSDDTKRVGTANDVFRAMPFKEKYVFCGELGSGGSGTVFQAYDRHLECHVAVKRFRAGDGIPGRELEMLKELRHPAFPAVMDYLEEDGYRYLVMEYIEGRNLADYIRDKGAVRQEQAVQWALELAEVLLSPGAWTMDGLQAFLTKRLGCSCQQGEGEPAVTLSARRESLTAACLAMQGMSSRHIFFGHVDQLLLGERLAGRGVQPEM